MDRDKLLQRIRALAVRTVENGCTEAEAMEAAKLMAKLCDEFDLSLDNLTLKNEVCIKVTLETGNKNRHPPAGMCMNAISKYCDVRSWSSPSQRNGLSYVILGLPSDVELAKYLYTYINDAMQSEWLWQRSFMGLQSHQRASFYLGMATRLSQRLLDMKRERTNTASTGTALVVQKTAIVEEAFNNLGMKLRSAPKRHITLENTAISAGIKAAEGVSLHRPIE